MASKVKNLKGLEKELTISFDSKEIEPTIETKLIELSKTLDLKGFRKGKVPMNVVKGKYYEQCFNESLSEHIEQNYIKVVIDEKLNPVAPPKISMEESKDKNIYTFKAVIEVMPEIELKNVEKIKLEKPILKVKKEDLEKAVDKIAEQYKDWNIVERESKVGDRVKADFKGTINGEEFENNKADDFLIEIGSKQLIPGFEEGVEGVKAGEQKKLDITFPDDYQDKKLASQPVSFEIQIKEVLESKISEIDEEFVKKLGIEDGKVESLHSKIEEGISESLSFLSNPKYTKYIYTTKASVVIVDKNFKAENRINTTLIRVEDAYKSFSKLLEYHNQLKINKTGIEQPVFISESANYGENIYIGAFAYIDDHVKIGDHVKIYPNV